jgi:hypothetical protein
MPDIYIAFRPDADLVHALSDGERDEPTELYLGHNVPASAVRRLAVYEAECVRLCDQVWPEAELSFTGAHVRESGAMSDATIVGESVTDRDENELHSIMERAWATALEFDDWPLGYDQLRDLQARAAMEEDFELVALCYQALSGSRVALEACAKRTAGGDDA